MDQICAPTPVSYSGTSFQVFSTLEKFLYILFPGVFFSLKVLVHFVSRCFLLLQLCPQPNPLLSDVEEIPEGLQ